jgi:hypothetical protein
MSVRVGLGRQTEKQFQGAVVELCRLRGYLTYHTNDSRRSDPGFPDLVIVGHGRVLYRELKREGGRVSPAQRVWIDWLERHGADVAVWTPKDWTLIERTL